MLISKVIAEVAESIAVAALQDQLAGGVAPILFG